MRLTFRAKLAAIVGTAALAFVALIIASTLITARVQRELANVQQRYLPKVELGPQLEAQFEHIHRGLQDAVAAHDMEALAETRSLKDRFLERLAASPDAVDPAQAAALRTAMEDYFAAGHDVSRRLIAGETGEALVTAIGQMQAKQARTDHLLKAATTFDRAQLAEAFAAAHQAQATASEVRLAVSIACLALVIILSALIGRDVLRSLAELSTGLRRFGGGHFSQPIAVVSHDELGDVAHQANQMAESLMRLNEERDRTDWLKTGQSGLAQEVRGELEPQEVAERAIRFLARCLEAHAGALYYSDHERTLHRLGQYALSDVGATGGPAPRFRPSEGLVGQAALQDEIMIINDPPADYLRVRSALGESSPRVIVLLPLVLAGRVTGVMELGLFKPWLPAYTELLLSSRETLTIAIEVARARVAMRDLLAATQEQAARLAQQEEELRSTNEELQAQQEELRQTNTELTHQAEELEVQRRILEEKNIELDDARNGLERKAAELTTVSAYKSQFLANMSHELRTPLNSMLLLSNLLAENEKGNLTDKQVEFARTIYSAGKDLLTLIGQVLDLAKVESGKQEVRTGPVILQDVAKHLQRVFAPLAQEKELRLVVEVAPDVPATITTDKQRLDQILTNFLGNALKFTVRGEIALRVGRPKPGVRFRRADLRADQAVAFAVTDSGIGIAPQNQDRIFAPFEQVDSAADRRYGGTGLGLGIARELATLLGGELQLESALGKGSTFTLYLPEQAPEGTGQVRVPAQADAVSAISQPNGAHLLLIEDDPTFAEAFGDIIRSQGLSFQVAPSGQEGLRMAQELRPRGIILDVKLPDTDGWMIMEALKTNPKTATIPVHFVSALEASDRGMAMGAVGYLTKPASRGDLIRVVDSLSPRLTDRGTRVLVVEDDVMIGDSLVKQLSGENLDVRRVLSARGALEALQQESFGCMILDLSLPDMDGLDLLRSLQEKCGPDMPAVLVYTARALSKAEAKALEAYTEAVVLKEGSSAERLLDEVRLFLRRLKEGEGSRWPVPTPPVHPGGVQLEGKRVLLVDDDMRTVYALSAALRAKGVDVLVADTGRAALAVLEEHPETEAVLMDIMMPEMDGYEAMRRIRQDARFRDLPIIALTAKAMKGDPEKCIEAGASDYLPKPIDADRLVAMLYSYLVGEPPDGA